MITHLLLAERLLKGLHSGQQTLRCHSHFADLFDPADAKVIFADMAPVDVNENSAFNSQIFVLNEDTYAATKVTNVEASAKCPDGAISMTPNAANLPVIAPAQQVSIRLDGVAPRHRNSGVFDECDLSVRVSARTGLVPGFVSGPASFSSAKVVRVWPTRISWSGLTVSTASQLNTNPTRYLQARFTIYPGIGYAAGAKGSIAVTSAVGEDVQVMTGREIEKFIPLPVSPSSQQLLIHKFDFQTRRRGSSSVVRGANSSSIFRSGGRDSSPPAPVGRRTTEGHD